MPQSLFHFHAPYIYTMAYHEHNTVIIIIAFRADAHTLILDVTATAAERRRTIDRAGSFARLPVAASRVRTARHDTVGGRITGATPLRALTSSRLMTAAAPMGHQSRYRLGPPGTPTPRRRFYAKNSER
jgi:hypothetical protein